MWYLIVTIPDLCLFPYFVDHIMSFYVLDLRLRVHRGIVSYLLLVAELLVMLSLIYCFMYLPLYVGVLCWSLLWYALLYVLFSFTIILMNKRTGCFAFTVVWVSCYCKCHVGLPHGAVGWSAVCGCSIF